MYPLISSSLWSKLAGVKESIVFWIRVIIKDCNPDSSFVAFSNGRLKVSKRLKGALRFKACVNVRLFKQTSRTTPAYPPTDCSLSPMYEQESETTETKGTWIANNKPSRNQEVQYQNELLIRNVTQSQSTPYAWANLVFFFEAKSTMMIKTAIKGVSRMTRDVYCLQALYV